MPSPNELVTEINAFLDGAEAGRKEVLAPLAADYAALCRATNERLTRCGEFLRLDLRSEAIHLAEIEPNLVDLVATIDLSRFDDWDAACQSLGVTRPPRLLSDLASQINTAYGDEAPLREFLAAFRRASISWAPLKERLNALRKLAGADPNNTAWLKDVREYQLARIEEIAAELAEAMKAQDEAAVEALQDQLQSQEWRIQPPEPLAAQARSMLAERKSLRARKQVGLVFEELESAFNALSYDECRTGLERLQQALKSHRFALSGEMEARVKRVVDWLANEDHRRQVQKRFAQARVDLERALDVETPAVELERLHRIAAEFDMALPAETERRFRMGVARSDLVRTRRARLYVSIAVLVALVATGVGAALLHLSVKAARVRNAQKRLESLMASGHIPDAGQFWAELEKTDADTAASAELLADKGKLDAALAADNARAKDFQHALETAKQKGPENPEIVRVLEAPQLLAERSDQVSAAMVAGLAQIEEARKLAKTPKDDEDLKAVEEEIGRIQSRRQLAVDRSFIQAVEGLSARLHDLTPSGETKDSEALLQATPLSAEIAALDARAGVSDQARGALGPLKAKVASLTEVAQQEVETARLGKAQADTLAALGRSATSVGYLVEALKSFTTTFPASPKTAAFRQALTSTDDWLAVEAWAHLSQSWPNGLTPADADDAAARITQIDAYNKKYAVTPFTAALKMYSQYLGRARTALDHDGPWLGRFNTTVTSNALLTGLWVVHVPEANKDSTKTYYIMGKGGFHREVISGMSLDVTFQAILTPDVTKLTPKSIKGAASAAIHDPEPSAASHLAEEAAGMIGKLWALELADLGLDLMELIQSKREADPVVRAALLRQVAAECKSFGWGFDQEAQRLDDTMRRLRPEEIQWMNPDDSSIDGVREKIGRVIDEAVSPAVIKDLRQQSFQKQQALVDSLRLGCDGVAVLAQTNGTWRAMGNQTPWANGRLVVMVFKTTEGNGKDLRRVGGVKDGAVVLDPESLRGVPEGTVVFICKSLPVE